MRAGADNLVRVWELASGQELLTLEEHIELPEYSVGGFYFTSGADVVACAFAVRTEDQISLARARLSFILEECQKYLHLEASPVEGE